MKAGMRGTNGKGYTWSLHVSWGSKWRGDRSGDEVDIAPELL